MHEKKQKDERRKARNSDLIEMYSPKIFIGFPVSAEFSQSLQELSPEAKKVFIQDEPSEYLQQYRKDGKVYLGKEVGELTELSALAGLESHIYSLLKKLVPDYSYESSSLHLLIYG